MTPRPSLSARALALQILREVRLNDAFAHDLLDAWLNRVRLALADRRLATQLVYGVLRRRDSLDALLRPSINRPLAKVEDWLMDALRLGAFQIALLTHIPRHAAVNETVELAAQQGRPAAKGFLNGVLRRVAEVVTDTWSNSPAADALPVEPGRYRGLTQAVLPSPSREAAAYLAVGYSLPSWLAQRWLARHGAETAYRFGEWFTGPAPLWLRVNRLRTDRERYLSRLHEAGLAAEVGSHSQAVRLNNFVPVRDIPGFDEGEVTVQDESGMAVGTALAPQPGQRVLDLCAAPGTKTTHLAELMGNQGRIVACDVDESKLTTLTALCQRMGVRIVTAVRVDARDPDPPSGPFDAVLVDAPCSNTGVLGRRPEVRWRLRPDDLIELPQLQRRLLTVALRRVRPGGVVVYSTCSIEPEENGQVVRQILAEQLVADLEAESEQWPGQPADGGYWARLRKR